MSTLTGTGGTTDPTSLWGVQGARNRPANSTVRTVRPIGNGARTLSIYPAEAGYALQDELDFLTNRAMEPNVFFMGRFLAPAMPRLEDRVVRLIVMRDEDDRRSRLRFLMPFSIERPGFGVGPAIIRTWANAYGPIGTPLLDREDAVVTIEDLFAGLSEPALKLPQVLVLPELRLDSPFARMLRGVALSHGLPIQQLDRTERPMLESTLDGDAYLASALSKKSLGKMRQQWRNLEKLGTLSHEVARQPSEINARFEEFLILEASGWKGVGKTAMMTDRYHAAFAREAVANLAAIDAVRIHTLDLDGAAIASLVVFVQSGEAYTWKTAFNEDYKAFSPGKLLMRELTRWHLDDPNIMRSDSCAGADHPIVGRLWTERMPMGTLIVGLTPHSDRDVRQVAAQLHLYRNARNLARSLRERVRAMARLRKQADRHK